MPKIKVRCFTGEEFTGNTIHFNKEGLAVVTLEQQTWFIRPTDIEMIFAVLV